MKSSRPDIVDRAEIYLLKVEQNRRAGLQNEYTSGPIDLIEDMLQEIMKLRRELES